MEQNIKLMLPETDKTDPVRDDIISVNLNIRKDGNVYLDERKLTEKELIEELKIIANVAPETLIYLRADGGLAYNIVAKLLARLKQNGLNKVALVTVAES